MAALARIPKHPPPREVRRTTLCLPLYLASSLLRAHCVSSSSSHFTTRVLHRPSQRCSTLSPRNSSDRRLPCSCLLAWIRLSASFRRMTARRPCSHRLCALGCSAPAPTLTMTPSSSPRRPVICLTGKASVAGLLLPIPVPARPDQATSTPLHCNTIVQYIIPHWHCAPPPPNP